MNQRGFTLVEMLITMAILGFIVLIITPNITGLLKKMDDEKYQRFLSDVFLATEAYIQANIDDYPSISTENSKIYIYFGQLINSRYLKSDVYDPKNKKRVDEENFTVEVYLNDDDEYSYKLYEEHIDINKFSIVSVLGATHKGIVYLDPTNLEKVCTEAEVNQNVNEFGTPTEIKTGCMKWYIFDDSGSNYKMILDHNTIARIKWNDSHSNVAYESSNLKTVVDDLVTTSGWEVTPRLITTDEVNTIVGGVSTWNASDLSTWFYFEGTGTKNQTKPTYDSSNRSSYDWLYNNLNKCKTDSTDYGCTIEDGNSYTGYGTAGDGNTWGYWTSTPVGTAGSGSSVWDVGRNGGLNNNSAGNTILGVRPVIEIPKSLFN